jgi:hypothetical protein
MKDDRIKSWDGVERRKSDRRGEEVRKCYSCEVYFPTVGFINICPDCIREMILHYKKGNYFNIKM